ncbi:MAG: hypothetical protein ACR2PG_10755 [Hyphomicrobiaceae bacterium]
MQLKSFALVMLLIPSFSMPSFAQRVAGDWELLGKSKVGIGVDHDIIRIGKDEAWYRDRNYRRLRVSVANNEVRFKSFKLVYLNDYTENLDVNRRVREGEQFVIDLPGDRSYLKQIEMVYQTRFGLSIGRNGIRLDSAVVTVHGELSRRRPDRDRGPLELDTVRVWNNSDQIAIRRLRDKGRFGHIGIQAIDRPVYVRNVRIEFGNGDVQKVAFNQRFSPRNAATKIDLEGRRRHIDNIRITVRPPRSNRTRSLQLVGYQQPGRETVPLPPPPIPEWHLLAAKRVNIRGDRDVIRVDRNADWHRTRLFQRLHILVDGNDIRLSRLRLVYKNGYSERFKVNRMIERDGRLAIDLGGERSYIDKIVMLYKPSRGKSKNRAIVRVFGEKIVANR